MRDLAPSRDVVMSYVGDIGLTLVGMPLSQRHQLLLAVRITDLYREVGTLLLAFAPLDFLLQPTLDPWSLFGFVLVGSAFFALSVVREIRRVK